MKNNQESDEDIIAEINMTPLIDIMLVLLIIFMVSSSVSLDTGIDINLPKSKVSTQNKAPSGILVSLNKEGTLFINGKKSSRDFFVSELKEAFVKEETTKVIIEGDEKSSLGGTVEIMDMARAAGASQFAIATDS